MSSRLEGGGTFLDRFHLNVLRRAIIEHEKWKILVIWDLFDMRRIIVNF